MNRNSGRSQHGSCRWVPADAARCASRRTLLFVTTAWSALTWTQVVLGQATLKQPILIGWLGSGARQTSTRGFAAFKAALAALGWKENSHVVIEERWADGRLERLQSLAEELAAKRPAVIVATLGPATAAAAKAAPGTPVVQANGGSPVDLGLARSLARPGGMVTGVTALPGEISEKYLELLLAAAPKLKRIGFLADSTSQVYSSAIETARRTAAQYRVEARFAEAAKAEQIEPALSRLAKEGVEALVVLPSAGLFVVESRRIVKLALARDWPVAAGPANFVEEGALIGYGADRTVLYRHAAYYVDRILKGAKPGDLPIEQPTKFDLAINMTTAKTLGLTIPPSLLLQAEPVIE